MKLAQTPGFLDLFHFRELCHMLTVNREALLPQSWGVGWEASGRTGVDLKENTVGGENVRKYGGGGATGTFFLEEDLHSLKIQHQRPSEMNIIYVDTFL